MNRRRQSGLVSIILLGAIVVLAGAMALSIDNGFMLTTHVQLQNAADSAALAAMGEVRGGLMKDEAIAAAVAIANAHSAGGDPVEITPADVQFGSFDFLSRTFTPGGLGGISAVRVIARRTEGSPGGPLDLFLAPVVGKDTANVAATSIAAIGSRDVMMVQDVTRSFFSNMEAARDALRDFSNTMSDQSIAGDRLGLVTFNEESIVEQGLSVLPDELSAVISAIDGFEECTSSFPPCFGTNIAPGVNSAIDVFTNSSENFSSKVIVLVSDGQPCRIFDADETLARKEAALAARDRAEDEGISIFSIYFEAESDPNRLCQGVPISLLDPDFMKKMTSGFGQYFETPDANDLDEILVSILTEMPLRVVQ